MNNTPNGKGSVTSEPLTGNQIGMLREASKLSPADFAQQVGMSPKRLLLLECGEEAPTPEEAEKIRSVK